MSSGECRAPRSGTGRRSPKMTESPVGVGRWGGPRKRRYRLRAHDRIQSPTAASIDRGTVRDCTDRRYGLRHSRPAPRYRIESLRRMVRIERVRRARTARRAETLLPRPCRPPCGTGAFADRIGDRVRLCGRRDRPTATRVGCVGNCIAVLGHVPRHVLGAGVARWRCDNRTSCASPCTVRSVRRRKSVKSIF